MLKVLHIGSHFGNIGDNASHAAVHEAIRRRVPADFEPLEIRRFYANAGELRFDDGFVDYANRFDLVLFGGGNFLEPVHAYSATGTTLDMRADVLRRLRVPFVLNAVAFDPAKGESEELLDRFRCFAATLRDDPRVMVKLRDDGSLADFERLVGPLDEYGFDLVPDPGLLYRPDQEFPFTDRDYLAVNLAGDLSAIRYAKGGVKDALFAGLSALIEALPGDMAFVLVPHVAMDMTIMGEFLADATGWAARKRILLAPMLQGYADFGKVWAIYANAAGIFANRFHSLVCNIRHRVPLVALANYPKIARTLARMGLEGLEYRGGGGDELRRRLLEGGDDTVSRRPELVETKRVDFERSIDEILAFAHA